MSPGKSTSLSKVCFWLKAQKFKVMLAACNTFRSGAVEQLKTHASRLDVPVFEKGYNKDAASIALDAVKYAAQTGFDVVLVDTAVRCARPPLPRLSPSGFRFRMSRGRLDLLPVDAALSAARCGLRAVG